MKNIFPTELNEFLQCRHIISLKKQGLFGDETISEEVELLQKKGLEHEQLFFESLEGSVISIDLDAPRPEQRRQTIEAMKEGADWVYQAYLEEDKLAGYADFLEKKAIPSALGDYSYEVLDTKLARRASSGNAVQLIHYAELIGNIQQLPVENLHLVHGDGRRNTLKRNDYIHYYREVLSDFRKFVDSNEQTEPFPVSFCKYCRFKKHCENYWEEKDHLSQTYGITASLYSELKIHDISTNQQLLKKQWHEEWSLPQNRYADIQRQARAQIEKHSFLRNKASLRQLSKLQNGSLFLLFYKNIQPQNGSHCFFMGIHDGHQRYEKLFIENAEEEENAFVRFVTFITRCLAKYPATNIVLGSNSDIQFLHDLSSRYNTCQDEIDFLIHSRRITAFFPLIRQALVLPVRNYVLDELYKTFCEDPQETPLARSPH
ncbi:MAG: TM0106 family RecB-like putative nuclease, partial [Lentisphaeraceae bacterium]|nr:TM0106 family RecB-like putative nuclease [Lentisphaeraceae bacterium]